MKDIYREIILENYRNPKNYGRIKNPDFSAREENVFCGDSIKIYLKLKGKKIREIKFLGQGCVISQASASILTEYLKDKTIELAKEMTIDDLIKLLGIDLSPTRMKCAELSLICLKKALGLIR